MSEKMGSPKVIANYLKEILQEAKNPGNWSKTEARKKSNTRPLSKLWIWVDKVKCFRKSDLTGLEDLSTAIEQTVVLVGQPSQSITYQRRQNVMTSLLRHPQKPTSMLKEELDSLVEKSNK